MVYLFLPYIAEQRGMNDEDKAWLAWLNGNTQNPVTTMLLLEAAPKRNDWRKAVDYWNRNYSLLEWDTDRRYHKAKFGAATERWISENPDPVRDWFVAGASAWHTLWNYAYQQPFMGRLSAWSMAEYAYILGLHSREPESLLLAQDGSTSHRNGLSILSGAPLAHAFRKDKSEPDEVVKLEALGSEIRSVVPGANYWTLESACCTYKSMHKPNRRYPGVYADMAYYRIRRGEERFGRRFTILWDALDSLPRYLQLRCSPHDPGLVPVKQNHYLHTGATVTMGHWKQEYFSEFDESVKNGRYGTRNA